jgi:hypothetical protein
MIGLRILILSNYGGGGVLDGYAPFEMMVSLVNVSEDLDVWYEFVLPKGDYWKYDFESVKRRFVNEKVRFHFIEALPHGIEGCAYLTGDLYHIFMRGKSDIFLDAVFNSRPIVSPLLKRIMRPRISWYDAVVPVFNFYPYIKILDKKRMSEMFYDESDIVGDIIGVFNDYMIDCDFDIQEIVGEMRRFFRADVVDRFIKERFNGKFFGIVTEDIDCIYESRSKVKREKVNLFFGGRWVAQKGFYEMLQIFEKVRSVVDVGVIMLTQWDYGEEELNKLRSKFPFIDFRTRVPRSEFLKAAVNEGDVFVSVGENAVGLGYLEMLYSGLIGVLDGRSKFNFEIVPEGYPFFAYGFNDFVEKVCLVCRNIERIRNEWVDKIRKHIAEKFNYTKNVEGILRWVRKKCNDEIDRKNIKKGSMFELIRNAVRSFGDKEFTMEDLCNRMTELSVKKLEFRNLTILNLNYIRQAAIAAGARDLCNSENPVFKYEGGCDE